MAVKERTLTQEIAWRLAGVYAAQTHGNYDEETLFDRGGDWAADEVGKVLSERLGVPTEALEAMNEALGPYVVDETRRVEEAARTVLKVFRPDRDRLTREQWRALEALEEALYGGEE